MFVPVLIALAAAAPGGLVVGLLHNEPPAATQVSSYARFEAACKQENCSEALVVVHSSGRPGAEAEGVKWLLVPEVRSKFHIYVYTDAPAPSMPEEFEPSYPRVAVPNLADEFSKYAHFVAWEYDRLPKYVRFMHSSRSESTNEDEASRSDKLGILLQTTLRHNSSIDYVSADSACTLAGVPGLADEAQGHEHPFARLVARALGKLGREHGVDLRTVVLTLWNEAGMGSAVGPMPKRWQAPIRGEFAAARGVFRRRPVEFWKRLLRVLTGGDGIASADLLAALRGQRVTEYRAFSLRGVLMEYVWALILDDCPAQRALPAPGGLAEVYACDDDCRQFGAVAAR